MQSGKFLNINGKLFPASQPNFFHTNRALRYGDGLFEGIRILNGEFLFYNDHFERVTNGMKALQIIPSDDFTPAFLYKNICDLLIANKNNGNAIIRLQVYRGGEGLYEPENNLAQFFIESFEAQNYFFNESENLSIDIFTEWKKERTPAMNFKTCNAQVYIMASIWKKKNNMGDVLILNSDVDVADATSSNVFIVKDEKIFTPALSSGAVGGVVRKNLIAFLKTENISVEEKIISTVEIISADEIFLTNVSKGIRSITSCGEKKYGHAQTKVIAAKFYQSLAK